MRRERTISVTGNNREYQGFWRKDFFDSSNINALAFKVRLELE